MRKLTLGRLSWYTIGVLNMVLGLGFIVAANFLEPRVLQFASAGFGGVFAFFGMYVLDKEENGKPVSTSTNKSQSPSDQ